MPSRFRVLTIRASTGARYPLHVAGGQQTRESGRGGPRCGSGRLHSTVRPLSRRRTSHQVIRVRQSTEGGCTAEALQAWVFPVALLLTYG